MKLGNNYCVSNKNEGIEYISVNNDYEYPDIWEIDYDNGTAKVTYDELRGQKIKKYNFSVEDYLEEKGYKVKVITLWEFKFKIKVKRRNVNVNVNVGDQN